MTGFWFGKSRKEKSWRKTPTKIGNKWYTVDGKEIKNTQKYFNTIKKRGKFWKGDTGWKNRKNLKK